MLSLLLATLPKCSAFQSTTIFRLPTPRKPPKSITAARTWPVRSTMTSTIRPMSSSFGLWTSRPSTPWASAAPMMVTEGGGEGCFDAAGGAGCDASGVLLPAGGAFVSAAAHAGTAASAAQAATGNANRRFPRIGPPSVRAIADLLARHHDRYLDLAVGAQYLERDLVAMAANPQVDAGWTKPQITQHHFVEEGRQPRIAQANFAALGVEFETECGFQQRERRRAGPCLRRTGHRIERRTTLLFTLEAAEQFR